MPTIAAMALATVLALVIEGWLRPFLGIGPTAGIGLVTWGLTYYLTRRWLLALRDGV